MVLVKKGVFVLAFRYKIDVISALKDKGYNSYVMRKEKIMGESSIQKLRSGEMPSWAILDKVCTLLELPIEAIIEHIPEGE